MEITNTILLLI